MDPEVIIMTRIELATPLGTGTLLGIAAGVITGIMAGPVGAVLGLCGGALAGFAAGKALHLAEDHRSARTRELDAVIGVTAGNLGAAPVSMPPPGATSDAEGRERWVAEWLTPPPPVAG